MGRLDSRVLTRWLLPVGAGAALLVLAWLALTSVADRNEATRKAMLDELDERLSDRVRAWEAELVPVLDDMVSDASRPDADLDSLQARWRARYRWFDSLYVWSVVAPPAAPGAEPGGPTPVFRYPVRRGETASEQARIEACGHRAHAMATLAAEGEPVTDVQLAEAFLEGCVSMGIATHVYATTEAAQLLREAGQPAAALEALQVARILDEDALAATPRVSVFRRVIRRLLLADLQDEIAGSPVADRLRRRTVDEVLALDAPQLESVLFLVPGVLDQLAAHERDTSRLMPTLAAAEQRLAAYREIRQNASRPSVVQASEGARFTYDQYSDMPYLLYSRRTDVPPGGVALQLHQDELLETFLAEGGLAGEIVVRDVSGRHVAGPDAPTSGPAVSFSETLRHLQAQLTESALRSRMLPEDRSETLVLLITALCIGLGLSALYVQAKANARHRVLLQRQRDFTARVTHELKTPLAGIKVMAENLALGAWKDATHRTEMADRIIEEADRLTERVNEILKAARNRDLPSREPVDIEEIVYDLLETWGPRYEQYGVRLMVDAAPTDPVLGDHDALRDAVACLLDNALKYRRDDVDSVVWFNTREDGRWVELEVVDNGLGVPHDQRRGIFERFVRVEGPNRGKSGGHGLGLAQVAEIVGAHRGTVTCEDGIDGGARFVVRLPATHTSDD